VCFFLTNTLVIKISKIISKSKHLQMIITRTGIQADIPGILTLQDQNLYGKMTEAERANGFVTTPFIPEQIEAIIEQDGLFVAEDKGIIIAYVFAGTWAYFQQWAIFKLMVARFPMLQFNGQKITTENSFQYGPACIAKAYTGIRSAFSNQYHLY